MKVLLILGTDYPTTRAYGVTTRNTAEALAAEGHEVEVLSTSNTLPDAKSRIFRTSQPHLRKGFRSAGFLGKATHYLSKAVFVREILKRNSLKEADLIWVRDLYLAERFRSFFPGKPLCVEIHQAPSDRQSRYLAGIDAPRTFWGPISQLVEEKLHQGLGSVQGTVMRLPMAAADHFFASPGEKPQRDDEECSPNRVGYFGSFTSGGHDQGVFDFARVALEMKLAEPVEFMFVGVGNDGEKALLKLGESRTTQNRLTVIPYVPHSEVAPLMKTCRALVLPYPGGSDFFDSRFPLKLVEYAACGGVVVLTETPGHLSVFPKDAGLYYRFGDDADLKRSIELVLEYESLSKQLSLNAREWAESFTYRHRILPVMNWMESKLRD